MAKKKATTSAKVKPAGSKADRARAAAAANPVRAEDVTQAARPEAAVA